jgi:hypothetical protein
MNLNTLKRVRDPRQGSALLASMIIVVILTFAAAGVLSYALTVYRNSIRQANLAQAKVIADSEMENLYYSWKTDLVNRMPVANVVAALSPLTTNTVPFAANLQVAGGWSVTRWIHFDRVGPVGVGDGSATGIVPGTTELGRNYYFTAETSATIVLPLQGAVVYKSGRHFTYSSTSLFQFALFYQGNLEMAAGGNMTISGPVSTNASAYLGAQAPANAPPFTLTLTDSIYYFQNYNGAADPLSGEVDYISTNTPLVDPTYNPDADPTSTPPADQAAQRALQVSKMAQQASFLGGVDVAADIANPQYAAAYTNLEGLVDPNEVYRAVIAPPPRDSSGNLLDEDPVVAASRMYNTAGIVITVDQSAPGAGNLTINVGTAANPTAYNNEPQFATIVHPTGAASSIIQTARTQIVDPRELINGNSGVNLTTVDVGNLNNALTAAMATNTTLASGYNGVVYVYDKTDNSTVNPNTLNGIRITDATTTPAFNDQNGNPLGFSMVTDNGLYVQGDYNKTQITVSGQGVTNPSALMGDAVTALSQNWNQSNAASLQPMALSTGGEREAGASGPVPANGVNPADSGTPNGMTVNAAILTGNTPTHGQSSDPGGIVGSGGAQNLVRMIEDWYYNPNGPLDPSPAPGAPPNVKLALILNGSVGQLFSSKYFSGSYAGSGVAHNVYIQPRTRVVSYDTNFKQRSPAGSPTTTQFTRGDFFYWQ